MTELEQEALSKQHSHGVWLVGLDNGNFAVFNHPNGQLLRTLQTWKASDLFDLCTAELKAAADRHSIRTMSEKRREKKEISLEDLGL